MLALLTGLACAQETLGFANGARVVLEPDHLADRPGWTGGEILGELGPGVRLVSAAEAFEAVGHPQLSVGARFEPQVLDEVGNALLPHRIVDLADPDHGR